MGDRLLPRLAGLTAIFTWALIVVGGVVRLTGSGMGCPDWPLCHGRLIPPFELAAWIEYVHRLLVAAITPLVLATAFVAWRRRRTPENPTRPALFAAGLLALQIGLGAVTVFTGNRGDTVVAHLLTALLLLAALVVTAVRSRPQPYPSPAGAGEGNVRRLGIGLVGLTLLLAVVGAGVQTTGGGFACPSFPLCQGELTGASLGLPAELHMLHRLLALLVGGLLVVVARPAWRLGRPRARRWAALAVGLYVAQVLVGVAQVMWLMPSALRGLHLALGAAFWAACVALVEVSRAPEGSTAPAPSRPVAPARAEAAPTAPGSSAP